MLAKGSKALFHIYLKGNFDFRFKTFNLRWKFVTFFYTYKVHPWIILCQRFRNKTNKGLIFVHICLSCFCVMNLILNIFGVYFQYIHYTFMLYIVQMYIRAFEFRYDICMSYVWPIYFTWDNINLCYLWTLDKNNRNLH